MTKIPDKFNLKNDFPETSYEEWKKTAEKDLKGIPFEKKLITKTYEGIDLQPLYTKDYLDGLSQIEEKPGFQNYLRGTSEIGYIQNGWEVKQNINYSTVEDFNEALRYDLERGQNVISISLDFAGKNGIDPDDAMAGTVGKDGISICNLADLCNALVGIEVRNFPIYFQSGFGGFHTLLLFSAYLKKHKLSLNELKGGFEIDPLGYAVTYGEIPVSIERIYDCMSMVLYWSKMNDSDFKVIGINTTTYHNSGANAVQELAYALATGVEYINQMLDKGNKIDDIAHRMFFVFGIGSFYFMEVAKLRAARILWAKIIKEYGGNEDSQKISIHAQTSLHNQTVYDPYVNMLRTTTEAFSAIVGGADSITTNPFDDALGKSDEFSRRVARNTQMLLKEESHLNNVIDPAGGSYYVEKLTDEVAKKAWDLFKVIQGKGGITKCLLDGSIQNDVEKIDAERKKDFSKRKSILIGSNMYANMKEEKLEFKLPDYEGIFKKRAEQIKKYKKENNFKDYLSKVKKAFEAKPEELIDAGIQAVLMGATIGEISKAIKPNDEKSIPIKPLRIHRASEIFEELRDSALEYKNRFGFLPKIFLATIGPLSQYKARADFARGFFEVGGFDVIYKKGFDTIGIAITEAVKSEARIVVLCSTDDTYPDIVPAITRDLKERIKDVKIILAGYPKDYVEKFKKEGIDDFIFLGADVYEVNKKLLGI